MASCYRQIGKTLGFTKPSKDEERKSFYVITVIFNPAEFSSRYNLYHQFAQHLEKDCGVQLVTIEAIFPSLGQTNFQVTSPDNPHHIQIKANSVLWLKENLINVAASRLPHNARYVCWLDADLTLPGRAWVDKTISALKMYTIVQVFEKADFLGPKEEGSKVLRTDYSFGYSIVHNKIIDQLRYDEWYPHPGYGWATTISTFHALGGLPEYDIVGSGDLHFAFSLIDKVTNALEDKLHPDFKSHVLQHSHLTYKKLLEVSRAERLSPVGYVPCTIRHNWHGSRKDRQYVDRWKILIKHGFNFREQCGKTWEGVLYLLPGTEELQADILNHFKIRNEDSLQLTEHDAQIVMKKTNKTHKQGKTRRAKGNNASSSSSSSSDDGVLTSHKAIARRRRNQMLPPQIIVAGHCLDMNPPFTDIPDFEDPYKPDPNCPPEEECPCPPDPGCPDPGYGDSFHSYPDGGYSDVLTSMQY